MHVRQLTGYDVECGTCIDADMAIFQGRDAMRALARVFSALVHRRTRGLPDGTSNPLGVHGAGWIGFCGLVRDGTRADAADGITVFGTLADGCRAAALELHERGYEEVQAAYRSGDPLRLARALETSPLRMEIDMTGFEAEIVGVTQKWWSTAFDAYSFRHIPSASGRRTISHPL